MRALQGAGLAVLPRYFVEPDLQEGRLRLLFPEVVMATDWFRLIWRRGSTRQSLLRELATELENRPLM